MLAREECALSTEQHGQRSNVALKDAQMEPSKEECVSNMGQWSNGVAVKDAQIESSREEFAKRMGQRSNNAVVKDAQIKLRKEEYAEDTEQYRNPTELCIEASSIQ